MDIEKEKSAFLDIYKYYPSAIKFTFDVENECFVLSKKNPLDHEVATISQMNQQWLAWLRRAKLEYEKLNGCVVDFQKEKIAHEKHLLSQGVDFKYLPNIQYNELENVYELIEWCEEYSEALNEINSSWCTWQAAKAQAVPEVVDVGRLQDRITELLDERQELYAQLDRTEEDSKRINFLADKNQWIANVQLPREIVERNLSSLRNAIDRAMDLAAQEPTND